MTPSAKFAARVAAAQSDIAAVLRQLEADTGQLVEEISIKSIEVTCIDDEQPRLYMSPVITLKRQPRHDWCG